MAGTKLMAMVVAVALSLPAVAGSAPVAAATDYLLMPRSELLTRPVSGSTWTSLRSVADASLGTANLCDQDEDHHLRTLASALVYARTGIASYATKARGGVMAAIATQTDGCNNATLALGRQLTGYVLAADFSALSGADDTAFRSWLSAIRGKVIGGHSIWDSLINTHTRSANNWGAYAGAARVAASLYLGDSADVAAAALVTRGFLGDRGAYAFNHILDADDLSWTCSGSQSTYTPVNPACTKSGINVDGAVAVDISRGGGLRWPPGSTGVQYQLDSIQGLGLQVELLFRNGHSAAWGWSSSALRRMAGVVTRSAASGGLGWNGTNAHRQMPWLLNERYGLNIPTTATSMGRAIGFTDWLYGSGGGGGTTPPPPPPPSGDPPVTTAPRILLSTTSRVPGAGVPVVVRWSLASSASGVRRYDLQLKLGSGSFMSRTLSSRTATSYRTNLASARNYVFRVRAVDRSGRVGAWVYSRTNRPASISDGSSAIRWAGSWSRVRSRNYLGGYLHSTNGRGRTATLTFSGASVAWVGPVGPTRGKARVYLDGVLVATVNLYRSSFQARRVVFARNLVDGSHTIVIRTLATSGHPTVAIDGLYVVNPS